MIKIICVGNIKDKFMKLGIENYLQKIKHYTKLEIIELKEGIYSEKDFYKNIIMEEELILKKINSQDYIIGLFIDGKQKTSLELSKTIENLETNSKNIVFIIGGSYGLSKKIENQCHEILSFSKLTFTHQMMRLFLLEQIFRSYKIIKNESYHK